MYFSRPIKILFDVYHLYHLPQFDPVIDLLKCDDNFKIFLSTSCSIKPEEKKLTEKLLAEKGVNVVLAKEERERAKSIRKINPDVFICGWSRYDIDHFVPNTTLVGMIYHGIGVKPSYWLDNHPRLDLRFVEGPYRIEQLKSHGIETDLELTGFTKLDPLFNSSKTDYNELKITLGLDTDKKTILFAPTFYPSSIEQIGLRLGDFTRDYNVILKPHLWTYFLDKFGEVDLRHQRNLFYELENKYSHIKLLSPEYYNIIPFYQISDLLLTEASSTIYEMIALGKPVIVNRFFKLKFSHWLFRYRLYRKRLNKEMNKDIANFCFEANRPRDLPQIIETALNKNYNRLDIIKRYQEKMLYKLDGKASERVRDAILSRLS